MKNEKRLDNFILLYIIIAYALIYFLIIANFIPNYASLISLVFIVGITIASYFIYGFSKNKVEGVKKSIFKEMAIAVFIYFTFIFTLGLFTGYYKNPYSMRIIGIIRNCIIPLLTITTLELFRYMFVTKNKGYKGTIIFGSLIMALFDVVVAYYIFELNLYNFFIFFTVIVLPLIFKNLVLSYITSKAGYQACLVYVIPLGLFKYFIPVVPALGEYLTCIINITLPTLIYIYASRLVTNDLLEQEVKRLQERNDFTLKREIDQKKDKKKLNLYKVFLLDIPLIFIFSIFVVLISGIFNYQLIGVDTSAISPTVSRGDAIMIYKAYKPDQYKTNDIIVYDAGNEYIVDRVAKVEKTDDGNTYLYVISEVTGDDVTYKLVTDEILGIYNKFRVPIVAYPTIWFKDFIHGGKK